MAQQSDKHVCLVCSKSYERADHLRRHVQSHQNHRQFRCRLCPKGFDRADLLQRHELAHSRAMDRPYGSRQIDRASQACKACVRAKARCSDLKPCSRCHAKSLECQLPDPSFGLTCIEARSQERQSSSSEASQESRALDQQEKLTGNKDRDGTANDTSIESQCADVGDVCPVSSILEDMDFSWFDSGLLALTMGTPGDMATSEVTVAAHGKTGENEGTTLTNNGSPGPSFSSWSEAYRRCAWTSWHPSRFQHSFHGQDIINLGPGSSREKTTLLMKASKGRMISSKLDDACRDRLLVLVTAMKISHFSIHTFPPADLLNDLVRFFFIQESVSLASSIHPGTFSCYHARPELLLGIIAAGAVIVPERRIQVTGLVIHEILRRAMGQLYESDNSTTRDLQALQAYLRAWTSEPGAASSERLRLRAALCSRDIPCYYKREPSLHRLRKSR